MANLLMKAITKGHVALYQLSGGTLGTAIQGMKVLLLTTRGRKSGAERTVPIVPFVENKTVYVIASMGGAPQHPAWFFNLEANPDVRVQFGTDKWAARAVILPEAERARVWPLIVAAMPNFGAYQVKTTRTIPVIRLDRVASA